MSRVNSAEQVERIFVEHVSFLYPTITIASVIVVAGVAAAIVFGIWWLALVGFVSFLIPYVKSKGRNRFILTNKRFIRELYNPHHSLIAVPLAEIVDVKLMNRSTDKYGGVRILTSPHYGDQLLLDGDHEYGVIMCHKVADHATFKDVVKFAADTADLPS